MWFEYIIFVLIALTQIYCCNGITELYRSTDDAKPTDGILRRQRREAKSQFISNRHVHDFTDGSVLILDRQTLQGSSTDRIILTQQHTQPHYAHSNNQYYQQQPQAFQRIPINNAQKPRSNQQAHNSRQLQINGQYNSNNNVYHNDNGFNEYYMKNGNKLFQEPSGQIGIMHKHNQNNGNYNHHNTYQAKEYNNENTRNSAILDTNVEMGAKLTNAVLFTRPAVRMEAINQPQNIHSNNNLLTKIIAQPVPTTTKAPTSTEYNRCQFRRNIPDNPFLNKEMPQNPFMQNPFLTNHQANTYTLQSTPPYSNNQSSQNLMVLKPTVQNPYTLNPFLQNTKIPSLSKQSQPTKVPATALVQSQIETTTKPFVQIISSTTPITTYPTSKVTTINAELSRLIRNKAVIFPDSIYLTRTTPSIEHILDIRR